MSVQFSLSLQVGKLDTCFAAHEYPDGKLRCVCVCVKGGGGGEVEVKWSRTTACYCDAFNTSINYVPAILSTTLNAQLECDHCAPWRSEVHE